MSARGDGGWAFMAGVLGLGAAALLLALLVVGLFTPSPAANTDPRHGPVPAAGTVKQCDGSTLVYRSGAAIPNSPECGP